MFHLEVMSPLFLLPLSFPLLWAVATPLPVVREGALCQVWEFPVLALETTSAFVLDPCPVLSPASGPVRVLVAGLQHEEEAKVAVAAKHPCVGLALLSSSGSNVALRNALSCLGLRLDAEIVLVVCWTWLECVQRPVVVG